MTPNTDDFRIALTEVLSKSEELGLVAVEVNSGNLHRRVGGYPGPDHRMPMCCEAMYALMGVADSIVAQPASGKGASVVVRYVLPR